MTNALNSRPAHGMTEPDYVIAALVPRRYKACAHEYFARGSGYLAARIQYKCKFHLFCCICTATTGE